MRSLTRRDITQGAAAAMVLAHAPAAARAAASSTLLVTHPAFAGHQPGPLHPERPARMQAIDEALADPRFGALVRMEAPRRDDVEAAILRVHRADYLDRLRAVALQADGLPYSFDADTVMSASTWEATLRGVGAVLLAIDAVMDPASGVRNAFCQVRPPGHHAEQGRAMGFCFLSNAAIGAHYARARHQPHCGGGFRRPPWQWHATYLLAGQGSVLRLHA
jgi:acetoin utilization deacetylase AcuC-like enzyme